MIEPSEHSDRSLLRRVRLGESDAATALYERYVGQLRTLASAQTSPVLASRMDADDIVQSVFRTFFRRVNTSAYDVPDGEDLWRLFLVIGLNKIRNAAAFHKAAKRDVRQTQSLDVEGRDHESKEGESSRIVLNLVIEESIAAMPQTSRELIRLRLEGHEVQAIAQQCGRSKRSVERALQNYREHLKTVLEDDHS